MAYTKIAQFGAGGNLGVPVLKSLVTSGKFDITVIARTSSSYTCPFPNVKVVKVDLNDQSALVSALNGVESVVITLGDLATLENNTKLIVDAAIKAGVPHVIPSDFGSDLHRPPGTEQAVFAAKHNVSAYLKSKEGQIEYTGITTGPFFDWGLQVSFLGFDIPNRKATIFSGGNRRINATNLDTIGQAVVNILSSPAQFKNRFVRIHDFYVNQQEIKAILEEIVGQPFAVEEVDAAELEREKGEALGRGEFTLDNIYGLIKAYVFGPNSSADWGENDDSEEVGLLRKDLKTALQEVVSSI